MKGSNAEKELEVAQRTYKDILNGYSELDWKDEERIYIKHLSDIDHGWIKDYKNSVYNKARNSGLFTLEEKLESLEEQGLWSKEKQKTLDLNNSELSRLEETHAKLFLKSQRSHVKKEIDKLNEINSKIVEERDSLVGVTCESFAEKKVNERYIYQTLYKTKEFSEKFFTEEEFEELDEASLHVLVILNNEKMEKFLADEIKKVAAAPFALNSIMLCKNNPFVFFGKPIVELSNYQLELFANSTRYKSIIEQKGNTPPPRSSLSECVSFYENKINIDSENGDKEAEGSAKTLFGASEEEMRAMAEAEGSKNVVSLADQASKAVEEKGSTVLSMEDMMKIHGV